MTEPTTPPHVVGVDLSLTATGLAWPDSHTMTHGRSGLSTIDSLSRKTQALCDLTGELAMRVMGRTHLGSGRPSLVVLEGLIQRGGAAGISTEKAFVWYRLVEILTGNGVPVLEVSVSTAKLYMTGRGDSNKREVVAAVGEHLPAWEIHKTNAKGKALSTYDDNKADAVALVAIGCDLLGHPIVELPARHRKALDKLTLPEGAHR